MEAVYNQVGGLWVNIDVAWRPNSIGRISSLGRAIFGLEHKDHIRLAYSVEVTFNNQLIKLILVRDGNVQFIPYFSVIYHCNRFVLWWSKYLIHENLLPHTLNLSDILNKWTAAPRYKFSASRSLLAVFILWLSSYDSIKFHVKKKSNNNTTTYNKLIIPKDKYWRQSMQFNTSILIVST